MDLPALHRQPLKSAIELLQQPLNGLNCRKRSKQEKNPNCIIGERLSCLNWFCGCNSWLDKFSSCDFVAIIKETKDWGEDEPHVQAKRNQATLLSFLALDSTDTWNFEVILQETWRFGVFCWAVSGAASESSVCSLLACEQVHQFSCNDHDHWQMLCVYWLLSKLPNGSVGLSHARKICLKCCCHHFSHAALLDVKRALRLTVVCYCSPNHLFTF